MECTPLARVKPGLERAAKTHPSKERDFMAPHVVRRNLVCSLIVTLSSGHLQRSAQSKSSKLTDACLERDCQLNRAETLPRGRSGLLV